ncbi:MAG: alanine racemase [Rickettsiales bacterium]|nr:alanine racemase [Rickettsiales bacterium]
MVNNATLNINLNNLKNNYLELKNIAKNSITAAVIKANAYGLGVLEISKKLYEIGCKYFFVATLDEGIEARNHLPKDAKIYVFNGIFEGEEKEFYHHNLIPILNDFYQLEIWANYTQKALQKLNAALHFDTGMNRLGFNFYEAESISKNSYISSLSIDFIMSHLACASDKNHSLNQTQLERFLQIKKIFPTQKFSLANSGGVINGEDFHFDITRPGYNLYSKNVVTLKAKIIQIREILEDSFVGYNATHKISKGSKIAVIPIGYADGYTRILSNNFYGMIGDYKVPQIGIISMDSSIFDVSNVPENILQKYNEIVLLNDKISVCEMASKAQTIGYEILTKLGRRIEKTYVS